jgi:hypothetical protein
MFYSNSKDLRRRCCIFVIIFKRHSVALCLLLQGCFYNLTFTTLLKSSEATDAKVSELMGVQWLCILGLMKV